MSAPTIALIGPMGAGKTSIGRRVARQLGLRFVDTDAAIVREHGPIAELFTALGEPGFRAIERAAVAAALDGGGVVSLGGGAVLDAATRDELAGCTVVLLTVSEQAVADRLRGARRPLLAADPADGSAGAPDAGAPDAGAPDAGGLGDGATDDRVRAWRRILAERLPLYEQLADVTVDTSGRPMTALAGELAALIAAREPAPAATR